jgi:transcriptional regulator with XRE-family HTH domain
VGDVREAFGQRLRELRRARELSQEEVAHRAGMHVTYLGGIERGERNPALVNINRLANALEVSLAELFSIWRSPVPSATKRKQAQRTIRKARTNAAKT